MRLRLRSSDSGFWLAFGVDGNFGGDTFQCELAGEIAGGVGGGVEEGVIHGENDAAVLFGTVEVGDGAGGEVAEDVRVVELVAAVVAAGNDGGGEGVPCPGRDASGALIEVAWVLMEEAGEDG